MENLSKQEALEKLDALQKAFEKETGDLRKIIENADKPKTVLNAKTADEAVEAAIEYLGESDEEVKIYRNMLKANIVSRYLSEQRCVMVCKALNEKKALNSTTYTPWFDKTKKPAVGFYHSCSTWSHDGGGGVSFRLHLNNRDHAIHAGKIMEKEYYNYLIK